MFDANCINIDGNCFNVMLLVLSYAGGKGETKSKADAEPDPKRPLTESAKKPDADLEEGRIFFFYRYGSSIIPHLSTSFLLRVSGKTQ